MDGGTRRRRGLMGWQPWVIGAWASWLSQPVIGERLRWLLMEFQQALEKGMYVSYLLDWWRWVFGEACYVRGNNHGKRVIIIGHSHRTLVSLPNLTSSSMIHQVYWIIPCRHTYDCYIWYQSPGMTMTCRSESMNTYLDGYVHSNTMLNEFVV